VFANDPAAVIAAARPRSTGNQLVTIDQARTIFMVFALPLMRPGDRDFLGAYSTHDRAKEFVDAQDAAVRGEHGDR
jgi:hypothetical protein